MFGYFGPEGTFTHQALLMLEDDARFAGELTSTPLPYPSVAAALDAVRTAQVNAAMVPIENSVEGGVSATLDNLGDPDAIPLRIVAEVLVNVSFDLAVPPGASLRDVHNIVTHPHAAAQTRDWVTQTLPDATVHEQGSTAAAAQQVANPDSPFDAAICAPVATQLYGLTAAAHDIGDNDGAVTRFVLVAKPGNTPQPTGHDKTTLVAYLRADHAGALLEVLQQLAVRGVNLCRIESRPTKTTLGSYCFSIDAEGHISDQRMSEALRGLRRVCQNVIFLGSYARADGVTPQIPTGASDNDYRQAATWLDGLAQSEYRNNSPA